MYWYEEEVQRLEKERAALRYKPSFLFYGSSTLRLWHALAEDLPEYKPVNLGFGGSTLAACVWFFDRILASYTPDALVLYAGDNDLGDGRHPEEVFIFFQQLAAQVRQRFGHHLPCYFISLKISPSRHHLLESFKYANHLIATAICRQHANWKFIDTNNQLLDSGGQPQKKYFEADGLHLNQKGYARWSQILRAHMPPAAPH